MTWADLTEKASGSLVGFAVVTVASGAIWIVRRVFTNQKQLEMLKAEIAAREVLQAERMATQSRDTAEIKSAIAEIRSDVKTLFQRH
jgi:fatty acid-binding protein DegV